MQSDIVSKKILQTRYQALEYMFFRKRQVKDWGFSGEYQCNLCPQYERAGINESFQTSGSKRNWICQVLILFIYFPYAVNNNVMRITKQGVAKVQVQVQLGCYLSPLASEETQQWPNPDAEKTRQSCYWWRALLLKINNVNMQGGLPVQKEWKTCLAFRDLSIESSDRRSAG